MSAKTLNKTDDELLLLHEKSKNGYELLAQEELYDAFQAIPRLIERAQKAERVARDVALAIGDRTHGAMASECNEWRENLEAALAPDPQET